MHSMGEGSEDNFCGPFLGHVESREQTQGFTFDGKPLHAEPSYQPLEVSIKDIIVVGRRLLVHSQLPRH